MADFNVNLSGPQGQGARPLEAVREAVAGPLDVSALGGVVDIFARGLANKGKAEAEARKNAVIKEYINNENVYIEALTSGQWNAAHVGMASRANYNKMRASYPEYVSELMEARKGQYEGTETGEAQKQIERDTALREQDRKDASGRGYTFYPGMGSDAENKTLEAYKTARRVEQETEARYKANAEVRAANGENRAAGQYQMTVQDYQAKEESIRGLVMVADKNLDSLSATVQDLMGNTKMSFEEKVFAHSQNVNRIKQGLLAVSATNPALAAPWQKLVEDIDIVAQKMLDPKGKSQAELDALKSQWDIMKTKAKLAAVNSNPKLLQYVIASEMFSDPSQITLHGSADIGAWLAGAGSGDPKHTPAPMVGTPDEKNMLKALKGALNNMDKSPDKEKATIEAVNAANAVMKQTSQLDGSIGPSALKDLSAFYSSPAFGKLAATGKVDMATMQNAKQVFQVAYEPAVKTAIMNRLDKMIERSPGRDGGNRNRQADQKISETVDIVFSGSQIVFRDKPNSNHTIGSSFERKGLDEAAAGLNTLIHMGAHLEGTTDYGKYWEKNRHLLMPGYFLKDVKEGATVNGYKYLGGDARVQKNWELVKKSGE